MRERERVLVGLLVAFAVLGVLTLWRVFGTVLFAITVAYVLYPVRRLLADRGLPGRFAAAGATIVGFLAVLALIVPLGWSIYRRRGELVAFLRSFPDSFELEAYGFSYTLDVAGVVPAVREFLSDAAVGMAGEAAVLGMKAFLFVFLVYALLLKPRAAGDVAHRIVPASYHDLLQRYHERTRDTLFAIYGLQAATAFGTFVVGWLVFWLLGYDAAFSIAVIAGILQFIPVLGPIIIVAAVSVVEVIAGSVGTAILVLAVGAFFVGFLPDALIRPKFAAYTTGIPASLYFIGFAGGVFSIGLVGIIVGPLVVVLFAETVDLIAEHHGQRQEQLGASSPAPPDSPSDPAPGSSSASAAGGSSSPSSGASSTPAPGSSPDTSVKE